MCPTNLKEAEVCGRIALKHVLALHWESIRGCLPLGGLPHDVSSMALCPRHEIPFSIGDFVSCLADSWCPAANVLSEGVLRWKLIR